MLLLYAAKQSELEKLTEYEMEQARMCGVEFLESVSANEKSGALVLKGRLYPNLKEHFGFRDGISQPIIDGAPFADKFRKRPKDARISA